MAEPIWKDYYVNFGNVESVDYEIRLIDGSVIFAGRAYRRPNDITLQVKINDICADYIESTRLDKTEEDVKFASNDVATLFRIFNSSGTLIDDVTFVNDWSYDHNKEDNGVLSDPINGKFDVRMPLLYSVSEAMSIEIEAQDTSADFNIDFSKDFFVGHDREWVVEAGSAGTLTLKNIFAEEGEVRINGKIYKGILSSADHALYYINAYGGWDFILMQGRSIETDKYQRKERKQEYDNRVVDNRGTFNYLNEIEKTLILHTGFLVREEGKKMHHLLGSTEVFLFDLSAQTMIPVVVTDSECRYKTYGTEGGMLVDYELNIKEAHNRIRR